MGIRVETNKYKNSHGKAPRGYGQWAFKIGGEYYFYPPSSYAVAQAKAKAEARKQKVTFMEVAP